jgi:uncharacterized protein (TIGR02246 family)
MTRLFRFIALALLALAAIPAHAQRNEARDRAEIHALLMAYGSTLDSRDFDGFGKLFGEDGVYVGGGGREAKGAAAGEMMRQVFANNPNGVGEPNFHLFYNEVVTFDGADRARATSMSLWMVPDQATKRPTPLLAGRYEDELVRKNGKWLFARRVVKSVTNRAPEAK